MRRADREIKEFGEIVEVLGRCDTIRLGLHGEEYPYVVPLSFGYEVREGKLCAYIHGAREGLKHDLIAACDRVCVEADRCLRYVDLGQDVTTEYESVIGFGVIEKVEGKEALRGLDLILEHCGFGGRSYDPSVLSVLTVYRICLETVTGKRRQV